MATVDFSKTCFIVFVKSVHICIYTHEILPAPQKQTNVLIYPSAQSSFGLFRFHSGYDLFTSASPNLPSGYPGFIRVTIFSLRHHPIFLRAIPVSFGLRSFHFGITQSSFGLSRFHSGYDLFTSASPNLPSGYPGFIRVTIFSLRHHPIFLRAFPVSLGLRSFHFDITQSTWRAVCLFRLLYLVRKYMYCDSCDWQRSLAYEVCNTTGLT